MTPTDVKLQLKKTLINFNKKPVKDFATLADVKKKYPTLSQDQLMKKCPNLTFGKILPRLLLQVPTQDVQEKLKLFRWASKIEDKLVTEKGELTLDLNQINELYGYLSKIQQVEIVTLAPILIKLDELKDNLK